jgi:hypothetical protein
MLDDERTAHLAASPFIDMWTQLRPNDPGYTYLVMVSPALSDDGFRWDSVTNKMLYNVKKKKTRRRADLIVYRSSQARWIPQSIDVIGTTPLRAGLVLLRIDWRPIALCI